MDFEGLQAFLNTHWGWAAGLAASAMASLFAVLSLLNPARKDDIALWLLGAQSDADWSRRFCALFDMIFGDRHLTLRCFLRSALASLLSVCIIWFLLGNAGAFNLRISEAVTLETVLLTGLVVNVLADYVSLLQTRILIGHLHKLKHPIWHLLVLLVDLVLSAVIIWAALWLYVRSPLYAGGATSFAETLGMFSYLAVFFYSTFFTSVWSWIFVLSTWILRFARRTNLGHWLDVEHKPIPVLVAILGVVVFTGALGLAAPLRTGADGLSPVDTALCSTFEGRVCTRIAALSPQEQTQLALMFRGCTSGAADACLRDALMPLAEPSADETLALNDRQIALLDFACEGGIAVACQMNLWLNPETLSQLEDETGGGQSAIAATMARRLQASCAGGDMHGCVEVSMHYLPLQPALDACDLGDSAACIVVAQRDLIGDAAPPEDLDTAISLMRAACSDGIPQGCLAVSRTYLDGIYVEPDLQQAMDGYLAACDLGAGAGCTTSAILIQSGILPSPSLTSLANIAPDALARRLVQMGCWAGDAEACTMLGATLVNSPGFPPNPELAITYFQFACAEGHGEACSNLAYAQINTLLKGHTSQNTAAQALCDIGEWKACAHLVWGEPSGKDLRPHLQEAAANAVKSCELGHADGCELLSRLLEYAPPRIVTRNVPLLLPIADLAPAAP